MKTTWKRVCAWILCVICLTGACISAAGEEETLETILQDFKLSHGDRNSKKIAITVDDCYKSAKEFVVRDVELCKQYNIHMTFFPLVYTGFLEEQYRDIWQSVLDAGCEIGSHTYSHKAMRNRDYWGKIGCMGRWQEALDKTLGYHYETRWLRPPYGEVGDHGSTKAVTKAIRDYGYTHYVHWDVSETKDLKKAMKNVQGGSILLFHAKKKDTAFLEKLIPMLLEAGYEPVTVSELFGLDPVETSEELYVYDREKYRK